MPKFSVLIYDLVDREVFLTKAKVYGIKGAAYAWLQSYLSDRKQVVQVNDARSSPSILAFGIPEGSSCSCLVFALFVGDISDWLNDSQAVAYADDTFIWVEANTIEELRKKLESEGRKVLEYFEANRFVTNPTKTGLLILRPNKNNYSKMVINLAGAIVEEVADAKMLGICVGLPE